VSLIGIVPTVEHLPVIREFFELFKTPWEVCQPGRHYDVVLAPAGEVPDLEVKLLIVYGPDTAAVDDLHGIVADTRRWGGSVDAGAVRVPIYGQLCSFAEGSAGAPCVTSPAGVAGLLIQTDRFVLIRLGYDLFREVQVLLSTGQPVEHAHTPTLDVHIGLLRQWIVDAGVPLLEIAAAPAGHEYVVCLTHDIDFVGIRRHLFDHTMWGFLYRSTVGAVRNVIRRRLSLARLLKIWAAVASLPFVYLGWAKDFWEPFAWYLHVERGLATTYYLIPFKGRAGEHVPRRGGWRRATAYDVTDLGEWNAVLIREGCELGVHGIDAWHDEGKGRHELERIAAVTGQSSVGIRMHWLLYDQRTPTLLERAGYSYDATAGYNDTVGYRNGTTQVFRPSSAGTLLELPLHIQDGALFFPQRLDLSESEAEERCDALIAHARKAGGVLTVLWHDRSHGPERFWDAFYIRLVETLKSTNAWFATAGQAVSWFRKRREVRFERVDGAQSTRVRLRYEGAAIHPPLRLILHSQMDRGARAETSWCGGSLFESFSPDHQPQAVGYLS
jgi:hypothetical protein